MEILGESENRYSGIPTIRKMMADAALPAPEFIDNHVNFRVILYNRNHAEHLISSDSDNSPAAKEKDTRNIIDFCRTPRSRDEIVSYLGIPSRQYALKRYLEPLVESGEIQMTNPASPRSRSQKFVAADKKGA
jgi:ATP-dependent DNA helicase RecG